MSLQDRLCIPNTCSNSSWKCKTLLHQGAHIVNISGISVVACKVPCTLMSTICLFGGVARIPKACLACCAHGTNGHQANTFSVHKLLAGRRFYIGAAGWRFRQNPNVENADACLSLTDCQCCPFRIRGTITAMMVSQHTFGLCSSANIRRGVAFFWVLYFQLLSILASLR